MRYLTFKFRLFLAVAVLPLALLWPLVAGAERTTEPLLPLPRAHINDFAEVIDSQTEQRLNAVLENYKQQTGIDFVIATVKNSGSRDLYDYSLQLTDEWNLGSRAS